MWRKRQGLSAHAWLRSVAKWPMFVLHWDRLQKLDLTAEEIGTASKRLSMAPLGHIRVVRLKSERGLTLWVPKQASWGYLSLECKLTMDLDFEDISTFGKACSLLRPSAGAIALSGQTQTLVIMLCNRADLPGHASVCVGKAMYLCVSCSRLTLPSGKSSVWQAAGA